MSGIIVLHTPSARIDADLLARMTASMKAHGPDAQDTWTSPDGKVGFGHTLLRTTIHQAHEKQPLTLDGNAWIVADARLDDRVALISKLRTQGRTVREEVPDVNLILHAYMVWGDACHEHLIGDFGFIIWDEQRQLLYGARDHLGLIPLYYAETEGGFAMSTTMQALQLHPDVSDALNEQAIGDYLLFGCNQELETTFFTDIRCVPPAHSFRWEANTLRISRYWQLPEAEPLHYDRPKDYAEHFLDLFTAAVVDRMRTDKVGVSMSGGLDSTSIAAVAHRAYQEGTSLAEILAICSGFDWLMPDEERYWASLIAEHSGLPIAYLSAEKNLYAETIHEAWVLTAEPRIAPRKIGSYAIMRQAQTYGAHIVLNGLGGDPLFSLPRGSMARPPALRSRIRRRLRSLAGYGRAPNLPSKTNEAIQLGWLNPDFKQRLHLQERWQERTQAHAKLTGPREMTEHPFWHWALASTHPGFSSARMKMRFPFFDVRLLTYVDRLPPEQRARKYLLREAMHGLLPDAVRFRKKTPLQTDFLHAWAVRGHESGMEQLAAFSELAPYVDPHHLKQNVRHPAHIAPEAYSREVVLPLGLAYWLAHRPKHPSAAAPTLLFK